MIGVFDSGVGGLTVLREIHQLLPGYDTVYFGDTARSPYGNLSEQTLQRYALEDAELLLQKGATVIVVACNSASAAAGELLRNKPSVPVFDVSQAPIEAALRATKSKRIGVIGTRATIASGIHGRLLTQADSMCTVFPVATPLLAPLIEERAHRYPEAMRILRRYLRPLKNAHLDTLILGCTHYPIIQKEIERVMGHQVKVISSGTATAEALKQFLEEHGDAEAHCPKNNKEKYFVSGDPEQFQRTANWWLGKKVNVLAAQAHV